MADLDNADVGGPGRIWDDVRSTWTAPIEDVIAENKFVMIVGSERKDVVLQIGRPYWKDGMAFCAIAAWGMWNRNPDVAGASSLQAIALAVHEFAYLLPIWAAATKAKFYYPGHEEDEVPADMLLGAGLARTDRARAEAKEHNFTPDRDE